MVTPSKNVEFANNFLYRHYDFDFWTFINVHFSKVPFLLEIPLFFRVLTIMVTIF